MVKIVYRPDSSMRPMFGLADSKARTVYINQDLPKTVREFVTAHEIYHLDDPAKHWLWREIKANAHAGARRPLGFCLCVLLSLRPYRLIFYVQRFIKGQ